MADKPKKDFSQYDMIDEAYRRSPRDTLAHDRYVAAHDAITSENLNASSPEEREAFRTKMARRGYEPGKFESGRDIELGRADYPGFKKGGKVTATGHRAAFAAKRKGR